MITLAEWKLIGITLFITFFVSALVYGIILQFITRMKNKTQKRPRRQITCRVQKKTFKPENFISNYDEFIRENTKGMTLYEVKDFIKNVDLEIYRLVMKGVR